LKKIAEEKARREAELATVIAQKEDEVKKA